MNAGALFALRNGISQGFGRTAANWYVVLQASQFHILFYASRTLPNTYALVLTTLAVRSYAIAISRHGATKVAKRHHAISLFLLTTAGVVFRSEIAVLVLTQTLWLLLTNGTPLVETIIPAGACGLIVGLAITVPIDSFFWQETPLWPEWAGFYYNTILMKSNDWGVSPWHYYFTNSVPKLLMLTAVPLPLALVLPSTRARALALLIPAIAFVSIYSVLPHKEWRFIVYIVPTLTLVSALGASWIWTRRGKNMLYRTLSVGLVGVVMVNFAASIASVTISSLNYPGGAAALRVQEIITQGKSNGTVRVFADNLTCQTGLTRFLEGRVSQILHPSTDGPQVSFGKSEDQTLLLSPGYWADFDYALAEDQARCIGAWEIVETIPAYAGIRIVKPGQDVQSDMSWLAQTFGPALETQVVKLTKGWLPQVRMEPQLYILKQQRNIGGHQPVTEVANESE